MKRIAGLAAVLSAAVLGIAPAAAQAPAPSPAASPAARPGDVDSIEHLIAALYQTISGPAGAPRDWDRLRSLFWPGGRMGAVGKRPDGTVAIRVFDVETYISRNGDYLKTHPFFERGVDNRVEGFGRLATVQSLYESRTAPDAKPFDRGINSLQLANDGHRWWVISIFWADEADDTKLPPDSLPPARSWR